MNSISISSSTIADVNKNAATIAGRREEPVSERPDKAIHAQEIKLAFGRRVENILLPFSESINQVDPVKFRMLETITSIKRSAGQDSSNFNRMVSLIVSTPDEKRGPLLRAFPRFLTANGVADKENAPVIVKKIKAVFDDHGDFEVHNETKALQNQQELSAQQHAKEKSDFLSKLGQCVTELEPEWFEDRTYVQRQGGAYTVHMGKPDTNQATGVSLHIPEGALPGVACRNNAVTFKAGIMHGTTIEKEVSALINSLRRKELSHSDCSRLEGYSTTRISISLGADHLLSIYLLPGNERVNIKFLRSGEDRSGFPTNGELDTDVLVNIRDSKVFTALSYCLSHGVEFCGHPMITLDNFLKHELITFVGEKQVFLDLLSLFLTSTTSEMTAS